MSSDRKSRSALRALLAASQVGLNMVAATFAGLAIGYGLDKLFGTSPWMTLAFLFLGIVSGFVQLFREARRQEGQDGKQDL
ncbi:MAG: AtpZ/AtpI family protein [Thermodesulfovibrionales bacterium]